MDAITRLGGSRLQGMLSQGLEEVDCRGQFISSPSVELHELLFKGLWFRVVSVWEANLDSMYWQETAIEGRYSVVVTGSAQLLRFPPTKPITPPGMKVRLNTKKGTKIADVNLVSALPARSTLSRYLCRCASQDRKGIFVRCLSTRIPYHCISSWLDSDLSRCLHQSRSHTALRNRDFFFFKYQTVA